MAQLVHGPQYATGVGLVKFGAQVIMDANARQAAPPAHSVKRITAGKIVEIDAATSAEKSKFWEWLKAAF